MTKIKDTHRQARESARTKNGKFGKQQHSVPENALATVPGSMADAPRDGSTIQLYSGGDWVPARWSERAFTRDGERVEGWADDFSGFEVEAAEQWRQMPEASEVTDPLEKMLVKADEEFTLQTLATRDGLDATAVSRAAARKALERRYRDAGGEGDPQPMSASQLLRVVNAADDAAAAGRMEELLAPRR